MATYRGLPALTGVLRHFARGFYVIDLLDPDPVHQHLNPMYLRASQFDEGVSRADGSHLVLQYNTMSSTLGHEPATSGLWRAVASPEVAPAASPGVRPRYRVDRTGGHVATSWHVECDDWTMQPAGHITSAEAERVCRVCVKALNTGVTSTTTELVLDGLAKARDHIGYNTLDEVARGRALAWDPRDNYGHQQHLKECDAAEAVLLALASLVQV